jgi:hypothetical protein
MGTVPPDDSFQASAGRLFSATLIVSILKYFHKYFAIPVVSYENVLTFEL